ncbi:uncharacterized protein LOC142981866 [Anticarsia gemmatalis]|uniref:uncharacterized protein LOC142981866 n=1 Tax=Anticarsia gemmatalis TaxID=129554 RepID=UPI003F772C0F
MDLDEPLRTECTVSGPLSFILFISKIIGVAPLKFEKVRNRYRIRVCKIHSWHGQVISIIYMSLSLVALAADLTIDTKTSFKTTGNGNQVVWISDVVIVGAVVITGTFTRMTRMKNMIDCIARARTIHIELNSFHRPPVSGERNTWIMVMGAILLGTFTVFADYASASCFEPIYRKTVVTKKISRNNLFNKITNKTNGVSDSMKMNGGVKLSPTSLRRMTSLYCSLCDIIRQLNDSNGLLLVILLLSILLHMVITPYHMIVGLFHASLADQSRSIELQVPWAMFHFSKLLLVVEPGHLTHEQMDLTRNLVNQMLRYTSPDDVAITSELKLFRKHIVLNQLTYCPMQLFTLNRTLISAIMGSITTYLVVVVQL